MITTQAQKPAESEEENYRKWAEEIRAIENKVAKVGRRHLEKLKKLGIEEEDLLQLLALAAQGNTDAGGKIMRWQQSEMKSLSRRIKTVHRKTRDTLSSPLSSIRFWFRTLGLGIALPKEDLQPLLANPEIEFVVSAMGVIADQLQVEVSRFGKYLRRFTQTDAGVVLALVRCWMWRFDRDGPQHLVKHGDRVRPTLDCLDELARLLTDAFEAAGKDRWFSADGLRKTFKRRAIPLIYYRMKKSLEMADKAQNAEVSISVLGDTTSLACQDNVDLPGSRSEESSAPPILTTNGYVTKNRNGEDNQIAGARWQFMQALRRVLPAFFEELRDRVYPEYARQAEGNPGYWHFGWRFDTWRVCSDRENLVAPLLLGWARDHNVEGEMWILGGALQTLYFWHRTTDDREALDIRGFRCPVVVPILLGDPEKFQFENWGWDPQLWGAESWRATVTQRFEEALDSHIDQIRQLIESRGAVPAVSQFRVEHFEWLALFQCGGWSLEAVMGRATHIGHRTTISKGMHKAAKLMGMKVRTKNRKLKSS